MSNHVTCKNDGEWEPKPIRCLAGPPINIYINNLSLSLEINIKENNVTLIETLVDKIIIYRNKDEENNPDIDIRSLNNDRYK